MFPMWRSRAYIVACAQRSDCRLIELTFCLVVGSFELDMLAVALAVLLTRLPRGMAMGAGCSNSVPAVVDERGIERNNYHKFGMYVQVTL